MNPTFFATPAELRAWLVEHHDSATELWLGIAKKGSGIPSVTYAEALDEALCFGWIDGLKKSHDDKHFKQRFTPRKARSLWSKINVAHVQRLVDAGRMMPAGQAQIDAAKRDGRWEAAYHGGAQSTVPADLQAILDAEPEVAAFFSSLDRANQYAILFRLQSATKPELRAKRLAVMAAMLREKRVFHPTLLRKTPQETP
jgi:uncharacterized protein YdeI (YjbR/CyaY-like superfamily)